jgi:hypothetical protein
VATQTEHETERPREEDERGDEPSDADDEHLPYDGGLVRLESPGSELSEE